MRLHTLRKTRPLVRVFWLVMTFIGIFAVARGGWALTQPWGRFAHKLVALSLFFVWTMYFFYQFISDRIPGRSSLHSARFRSSTYAVLALTALIAVLYLLKIGAFETGPERVGAWAAIALFGLGTLYLFREALRK
jgi:hypothetical protein